MKIVAFDLSLTSTGVAWSDGVLQPTVATLKPRNVGCARLVELRNRALELADDAAVTLVEGYSFNSKQGGERLGELGGVIRVALFEAGVPFVEVPPATVKKLATARGNAPKNEVLACAIRRLQYQGSSTDEADARWLLEAAGQWYRLPWMTPLSDGHTSGLGKIDWPKRPAEATA